MSQLIPAFPLGLVCFPGETQNLHIFEPRYKVLIDDCINNGSSFALVPIVKAKVFRLATEVVLEKIVKKYPDGKSDVSLRGIKLLKISKFNKFHPNKPYPSIKASTLSWIENPDEKLTLEIVNKLKYLYEVLSIDASTIPEPSTFLTAKIIHKIGLSFEQELEIYSIADEPTRQKMVIEHLDQLIPTVLEIENLKTKVALNGHFKNIYPSEFE